MFQNRFKSGLMATAMILPAALVGLAAQSAQAQTQAPTQPKTAASAPAVDTSTEVQEVVVSKYRERAADVKELESANTVTVITASDLLETPDGDVAGSLSRVAGVNALNGGFGGQGNNNIGSAADLPGRGQAEYDSLRGLNAEYNLETINGVNVAQGQAYSREVQFDLLPPTGLQTIVINKQLTPAQDGDAIAGSFDFQTPNAYDFSGKDAFSFNLGTHVEGRALEYDRDPVGASASIAGAHKFGDSDQFGVYASLYYDYRNFSNSEVDGAYPAEVNGQYSFALQQLNGPGAGNLNASAPGVNVAQNLVATGIDYGLTTGHEGRYGGNISLDWRPSTDFQAYLRSTYARESIQQDTYYLQLYGSTFSQRQIGTSNLATASIDTIDPRYYFETAPEQAELGTFQVGFNWKSGALHLAPNVFGSWGYDNEPNHIEVSAREPEDAPYQPYGGSTLFGGGPNGPVPLLSSTQAAEVYNFGAYGQRRAGELSTAFSNQVRGGAKIDGGYDFNTDWLKSISFGLKFESAERNHTDRDYESGTVFTSNADDPSVAAASYVSGSVKNLVPGLINFPAPLETEGGLFKEFYAAAAAAGGLSAFSDICDGNVQDNHDCNTQRGIEQVTSAYVSGDLLWHGVQIIPGLRFEHTYITNHYYDRSTDANGNVISGFDHNNSTYDKVLPSIAVNYRPNPLTVYRAAIWTSYVKPSLFQLGGGDQISFSKDSSSPTGTSETITEGNPNLKALDAINYDASGEWRNTFGGYAVVAVFYKSLNNFFYDSVSAYSNATSGGTEYVQVTKPENGGSAKVYGVELTGRQKFTGMPAPFNGFGLQGNLTLERSAVHTGVAGLDPTERLQGQPNTAANAQFFYEKGPISAQLSYQYSGDYVSGYSVIGDGISTTSQLDSWVKASTRLDLHVSYRLPVGVRMDFSVANLLDNISYYGTIGKSDALPTIINSGRTFDLVARYSF
jgi:TonB-dependent receptor